MMLPFQCTIPHTAGAKIEIADNLPRDPKLPAPSTSQFDEQFVIKSIKNFNLAVEKSSWKGSRGH